MKQKKNLKKLWKRSISLLLAAVMIFSSPLGNTIGPGGIDEVSAAVKRSTNLKITYNGNVFTIVRNNAESEEVVNYRAFNYTAIEGIHFAKTSGKVTFAPGETKKQVVVDEYYGLAIKKAEYRYQLSIDSFYAFKSYYFEVWLDSDPKVYTRTQRPMQQKVHYKIQNPEMLTGQQEVSVDGEVRGGVITDGGYTSNTKTHSMIGYTISPGYFEAPGAGDLGVNFSMKAYEEDDGYQYLQIYPGARTNFDNANAKDGDPGVSSISKSYYMAGFEHGSSSKKTQEENYTFPVKGMEDVSSSVKNAWNNSSYWNLGNSIGKLDKQKVNSGLSKYLDGGYIKLDPSYNRVNVCFDASGSRDDDWGFSNPKFTYKVFDNVAPSVSDIYVSKSNKPGDDSVQLCVAFNEIPKILAADEVTLICETEKGESFTVTNTHETGSNVIPFKLNGIGSSEKVKVTSISGVKDYAGNELTFEEPIEVELKESEKEKTSLKSNAEEEQYAELGIKAGTKADETTPFGVGTVTTDTIAEQYTAMGSDAMTYTEIIKDPDKDNIILSQYADYADLYSKTNHYIQSCVWDPYGAGRQGFVAQMYLDVQNRLYLRLQNAADASYFLENVLIANNVLVPSSYATAKNYMTLLSGDIDADGEEELVVYYNDADGTYHLLAYRVDNGTMVVKYDLMSGKVTEEQTESAACYQMAELTIGDINGDCKKELIVTTSPFTISEGTDTSVNTREKICGASTVKIFDETSFTNPKSVPGAYAPVFEDKLLLENEEYVQSAGTDAGDIDGDGREELVICGISNHVDSTNLKTNPYMATFLKYNHEKNFYYYGTLGSTADPKDYQKISDTCAPFLTVSTISAKARSGGKILGVSREFTLYGDRINNVGTVVCAKLRGRGKGKELYPEAIFFNGAMLKFTPANGDQPCKVAEDGLLVDPDNKSETENYNFINAQAVCVDRNNPGVEKIVYDRIYVTGTNTQSPYMWVKNFQISLSSPELSNSQFSVAKEEVSIFGVSPKSVYSVCYPDIDNDSVVYSFVDSAREISDIKPVAILASAPQFDEVAEFYTDGDPGETSFGKSKGTESTTSVSASVSAGTYVSMEEKVNFFGLASTGVEAEVSMSVTAAYEYAKTNSVTYTKTFTQNYGEDGIVYMATPVDVYHYICYDPTVDGCVYGDRNTWVDTYVYCPKEPIMSMCDVQEYDKIAEKTEKMQKIGDSVIKHRIGDPVSYEEAGYTDHFDYKSDWMTTSASQGSSQEAEIELGQSSSNSYSINLDIESKAGVEAGGVTVGITAGVGAGVGYEKVDMSTTTVTGSVTNPNFDKKYSKDLGFDWCLGESMEELGSGDKCLYVTYGVKNVVSNIPKAITDLEVVGDSKDSITLAWKSTNSKERPTTSYHVYMVANNGTKTLCGEISEQDIQEDGKLYYKVNNLQGNTMYQFEVNAVLTNEAEEKIESLDCAPVQHATSLGIRPEVTFENTEISQDMDAELSIPANVTLQKKEGAADPYPATYQWQKAYAYDGTTELTVNDLVDDVTLWKDIENANEAGYKKTGLSKKDEGYYRLVVTQKALDLNGIYVDLTTESEPVKVSLITRKEYNVSVTGDNTKGSYEFTYEDVNGTDTPVIDTQQKVKEGNKVTITARANEGSRIQGYVINGSWYVVNGNRVTDEKVTLTVSENMNIEIRYANTNDYQVVSSASGVVNGGDISIKDEYGENFKDGYLQIGEKATVTATPEDGYLIAGWKINGEYVYLEDGVTKNTSATLPIEVTKDMSIEVEYYIPGKYNFNYTLSGAVAGAKITVTANGTVLEENNNVLLDEGSRVLVKANLLENYEVDYWKVNGERIYTELDRYTILSLEENVSIEVCLRKVGENGETVYSTVSLENSDKNNSEEAVQIMAYQRYKDQTVNIEDDSMELYCGSELTVAIKKNSAYQLTDITLGETTYTEDDFEEDDEYYYLNIGYVEEDTNIVYHVIYYISEVSVDTLELPEVGKELPKKVNVSANGLSENEVTLYWNDSRGNSVSVVEQEDAYTARFMIAAAEGYYVDENTKIKVGSKDAVVTNTNGVLWAAVTYGEAADTCEHEFVDYISNNDATCTEDGTKTAICEKGCGKLDTVIDENTALGHDWEKEYTVDVEATETTDGSKSIHCSRCDEKKDVTIIPATGTGEGTTPGGGDESTPGGSGGPAPGGNDKPAPGGSDKPAPGGNGDNNNTNVQNPSDSIVQPDVPEVKEFVDKSSSGKYTILDSNKKTVVYKPSSTKLTKADIPDVIPYNGQVYKVTMIADNAFKNNKKLTKVIIGKNVTVIGKNAFYGCIKLKKVSGGGNVKQIKDNAFKGCKVLSSLTLSKKLTAIGANAFNGCKKLKTLTIKSEKLTSSKVSKKAFAGLTKATSIKVPARKKKPYKKLFKSKGLSAAVKVK